VDRAAVLQPQRAFVPVALHVDHARVAAEVEHLEHGEERELGELAAQRLAERGALRQHRVLVRAGVGQVGVAGDAAERDGAARDLDPVAR